MFFALCFKGYRYRGAITMVHSTDATVHVVYLISPIHIPITLKWGRKVFGDFGGFEKFSCFVNQ